MSKHLILLSQLEKTTPLITPAAIGIEMETQFESDGGSVSDVP